MAVSGPSSMSTLESLVAEFDGYTGADRAHFEAILRAQNKEEMQASLSKDGLIHFQRYEWLVYTIDFMVRQRLNKALTSQSSDLSLSHSKTLIIGAQLGQPKIARIEYGNSSNSQSPDDDSENSDLLNASSEDEGDRDRDRIESNMRLK